MFERTNYWITFSIFVKDKVFKPFSSSKEKYA